MQMILLCYPYNAGIQHLLKISFEYKVEFDVKFYFKKSHVMIAE